MGDLMGAWFLGLVGAAMVLNGILMLPFLNSAFQQEVAATYIVGGFIVVGISMIVVRLGKVLEEVRKQHSATAEPVTASTADVPVSSETKRGWKTQAMASVSAVKCPNCGRLNAQDEDLCACGLSLPRSK